MGETQMGLATFAPICNSGGGREQIRKCETKKEQAKSILKGLRDNISDFRNLLLLQAIALVSDPREI